ncbi:MAG: hypothetical protein JSS27_11185 [Planctomycetes bacterium]|nr:hypothetical protein [Planctomycetota bacterium]
MYFRFCFGFGSLTALVLALVDPIQAQQVAARETQIAPPKADVYRKLAPGIETTIRAVDRPAVLVSRHDLVEFLTEMPKYGEREGNPAPSPAKNVRFLHGAKETGVPGLDFTFKPLRMITIDVPNEHGKMDPKLVWYLVYRVKNPSTEAPFRFIPKFTLTDLDKQVNFADQLIPVAIKPIQLREDPKRPLANTYAIAGEIPAGEQRWGVVTWTDLPTTLRRITITVEGLSMSYQWEDPEGAYKPGMAPGSSRKLSQQVLQIDFWRPGDEFHEHDREIRYGLPGEVDHRWLYQ